MYKSNLQSLNGKHPGISCAGPFLTSAGFCLLQDSLYESDVGVDDVVTTLPSKRKLNWLFRSELVGGKEMSQNN